ncbi:hypothetical protein D3C81_908630 [compost metagenome]
MMLQHAQGRQGAQCTNHQHIAVGKIDNAQNAVHHGVTQGDQRINAAEHQSVDGLLYQRIHRGSPEKL